MGFRSFLEMALDLSTVDDPFDPELKSAISHKKAIVYHGTSTKYFWDIINNGFIFNTSRKNYNKVTPGNYFSFNQDRAGMFTVASTNSVGGTGIIFVLEVPISMLEVDPDDNQLWDKFTKFQSIIKSNVPPKYITGVIYPATASYEIPIRKFLKFVNTGKIPEILPQNSPKFKFTKASIEDREHTIINYLIDLLQYTSLSNLIFDNYPKINRILLLELSKLDLSQSLHWNGSQWVKWLEKIFNEKNTEEYYQTLPEFKVPLIKVWKKYNIDYNDFLLTRNYSKLPKI